MIVVASRQHYADHLAPVAALVEDVPGVLVASYADLCTARRSSDRIVLMQHGAGQSYSDRHPGYPGGDDNEAASLFLTPGDHPAERWKERYPLTASVAVGSPRTLPDRENGPDTVAITFHWDDASRPESETAYPYFTPALAKLRDAFRLIGHGHPRARWLPRAYDKLGIEFVPTFDEVCRRADALIGDNTSALFEFAATGRPVVVMNSPRYRRSVNHGLRFWDAADVGVNVNHADDMVKSVRLALRDEPHRQVMRERAVDRVYARREGAAEYASEAIRAWAAA